MVEADVVRGSEETNQI